MTLNAVAVELLENLISSLKRRGETGNGVLPENSLEILEKAESLTDFRKKHQLSRQDESTMLRILNSLATKQRFSLSVSINEGTNIISFRIQAKIRGKN